MPCEPLKHPFFSYKPSNVMDILVPQCTILIRDTLTGNDTHKRKAWRTAGAAANALSLVEPAHAWLEDPAGPNDAPAQRAFLGSSLPEGPYLPAAQDNASPRSPLPEAGQQV